MVLASAGYEVSTALHGVDAILLLQRMVPDVVIYELNIAQVPGYDFLAVVRTRLPQVSVIAMTGSLLHELPPDVFADGLYVKGQGRPETLLEMLAELVRTADLRTREHRLSARHAFALNQRARRVRV